MAERKFPKGTEPFYMIGDYWQMLQKYWELEDTTEWWDSLVDAVNQFSIKYENQGISIFLALALINWHEKQYAIKYGKYDPEEVFKPRHIRKYPWEEWR